MLRRLLYLVELEPKADIVLAQCLAAAVLLTYAAVLPLLRRLPRGSH